MRATIAGCRRKLAAATEPVDPAKFRILDDVLAHTNRLAAEIDPFGSVAPVEPPEPLAVEATSAEPPSTPLPTAAPVQPDLFGGADAAPAARRVRAGRR